MHQIAFIDEKKEWVRVQADPFLEYSRQYVNEDHLSLSTISTFPTPDDLVFEDDNGDLDKVS